MSNEVRDLQGQMNQKTDESLESTRRMVAMCEETTTVGARTLDNLNEQGEKLDRVETGMTKINQDMKEAEKNLEGLEKCCGLFVLPWKKCKKVKEDARWKGKDDEDGKVADEAPRKQVGPNATDSQAGFITRITNDAREDEMEDNMVEVSGMLGNLKNMAIDMNQEIGTQNKQLDRINTQAVMLDERVSIANTRANKILTK